MVLLHLLRWPVLILFITMAVVTGRALLHAGGSPRQAYDPRNAYELYLSSLAWRQKRIERLILDRHRCQGCGTEDNLDVHHTTYDRLGDENTFTDLVTLCRRCHSDVHSLQRRTGWQLAYATFYTLQSKQRYATAA